MTEIKSVEQFANLAAQPEVTHTLRPEESAPAPPANSFASLKSELNAPLKNFLGRTDKLLEQAKALDLQMFRLDLQEIQGTARQLLSLLENPPKRQIPQPTPAPASVVMRKPLARRSQTVHNRGTLLIVDDHQVFQALVGQLLSEQGYDLVSAENGEVGLWLAQTRKIDLVLLDIGLPKMTGYEVLRQLKADLVLRDLPVIMLSALDQQDSIVQCLEMGAEDYLTKPFNPVILTARIEASLAKKRFRDLEQSYLQRLQTEQGKSERLLLNILPKVIANRLKKGEKDIVDYFPEATVLFADLVGFTAFSATISPAELVEMLNGIFSAFDQLVEKHGLEKIKTLGDAYMAVGGVPVPQPNHVEAIANLALDMRLEIENYNTRHGTGLTMRIGIHTGSVVAGIIGINKFTYDLWGDTVNTAAKMESHSQPGCIQVTAQTYERIKDKFFFEHRGPIGVKGKGDLEAYLLSGRLG